MGDSTALAVKPIQQLSTELQSERWKQQLVKALPSHIEPEKMVRFALQAISKNPALLDCTRESIYKSVLDASQLGLVPDGVLGHGYFVSYGKSCQFQAGYRGLIELAMRTGKLATPPGAVVVHKNDRFAYREGSDPHIDHEPIIEGEPGPMIAVYATARFKDCPVPRVCLMRKDEVDAIRKRSKAGNSGPWVTDYEEMAKKTVLRRLCKTLSLSPELTKAAADDEYGEMGVYDQPDATAPGRHKFGFAKAKVEVVDEPEDHPQEPETPPSAPLSQTEAPPTSAPAGPSEHDKAMAMLADVCQEVGVSVNGKLVRELLKGRNTAQMSPDEIKSLAAIIPEAAQK